jgi:dCTP diphosphatase
MPDQETTVGELRAKWRKFVSDRDWNRFHTAKNLSMAIAAEAAELVELFLWVEGPESNDMARGERLTATRDEVADIAGALLAFCNAMDIDLSDAIADKMAKNERKYPAETFRGRWRLANKPLWGGESVSDIPPSVPKTGNGDPVRGET